MEDDDKKRIQGNCRELVETLSDFSVLDEIKDYLYQKGVLSQEDLQRLSKELSQNTGYDSARNLLQIIQRGNTQHSYRHFCDALKKSDLHWLVDTLNHTDITKVTLKPIISDTETIDGVMLTVVQLNEQILRLVKENNVKPQNDQTEVHSKLNEFLKRENITEESAIEFLMSYSNETKSDCLDGVFDLNDAGDTSTTVNDKATAAKNPEHDIIAATSKLISRDIVIYIIGKKPSLSTIVKSQQLMMRHMVDKMLYKQSEVFRDMVDNVALSHRNGIETLFIIADQLFEKTDSVPDGISWGRIVSLFAFCSWAAKCTTQNNMKVLIVDFLSYYTSKKLTAWIYHHGGWDDFCTTYGGDHKGRDSNGDNDHILDNVYVRGSALLAIAISSIAVFHFYNRPV